MSKKKLKLKSEPVNPEIEAAVMRKSRLWYWAGGGAVFLYIFFLAFFPVISDDLFMYLALGRRFFAEGKFPLVDPFLFSLPNCHWNILHEWGTYLISYKLYLWGGWTAIICAKTFIILATAAIPLWLAYRLGFTSPAAPALVLLASYAACPRFIEKASLFSDFFTVLVLALVLIQRTKPGKWIPWCFPLIFLLWVNLNPGFHIGLIILGLAVLFQIKYIFKDKLALLFTCGGVASLLACLANPEGMKSFFYIINSVLNKSFKVSQTYCYEFMPTLSPNYSGTPHVLVYLLLLAITIFLFILAWKTQPWFELLVFLFIAWIGFTAIRFVPMSAFSLAILSTYLAFKIKLWSFCSTLPAGRKAAFTLNVWFIIITLLLTAKIAFAGYTTFSGYKHFGTGMDSSYMPVKAADFIDNINLRVPLFNQHDFGTYLAWRWDGKRKLFYHGFVDDIKFYHDDYLGVNRSPEEFDRIVAKYRIGAFLLNRYNIRSLDLPLIYRTLLTRPDWHLVYVDDIAMVFLKDLPENQEAIQRYKIFP
jgi:hypothetical protein